MPKPDQAENMEKAEEGERKWRIFAYMIAIAIFVLLIAAIQSEFYKVSQGEITEKTEFAKQAEKEGLRIVIIVKTTITIKPQIDYNAGKINATATVQTLKTIDNQTIEVEVKEPVKEIFARNSSEFFKKISEENLTKQVKIITEYYKISSDNRKANVFYSVC